MTGTLEISTILRPSSRAGIYAFIHASVRPSGVSRKVCAAKTTPAIELRLRADCNYFCCGCQKMQACERLLGRRPCESRDPHAVPFQFDGGVRGTNRSSTRMAIMD